MTATMIELTPTQERFRSAMANLSAGVNVVTTDGPAGRAGITVSAVCSVSDDPPTMLVCINRSSRSHGAFEVNGRLCINVLGGRHEDVALLFAGATGVSGADRFDAGEWDYASADVPVLVGSAASVIGRVTEISGQGSHSVMFVEVERIIMNEEAGGLVYFRRQFHRIGGHGAG
ncbi:flavin reductase [Nocardioides sp. CER19]|uniref:flavin reductase n=1 Tax=Nocardioides sp. CER19 TaxID=3038538 RepID=UPI00244A0413|nr:flavin reductase [Nocardioides sp. CER19]MDH2414360.1 flavin reductase [Nocardioides sp. CER19]